MTRHKYAAVAATRRVRTTSGTYYVCDDCAETLSSGGYVRADDPVENPMAPFFCECEHADHFGAPVRRERDA
jgi:hypothetical protein